MVTVCKKNFDRAGFVHTRIVGECFNQHKGLIKTGIVHKDMEATESD